MRLPHLISDGMVLQRDTKLKIWGWAAPGEKLRIGFDGKHYRAVTDASGKWVLVMGPLKAGGPYTMSISASNQRCWSKRPNQIIIRDIFVGDVWFCSGQSNMVVNMERVKEKYPDVIAAADLPADPEFLYSHGIGR